MIREALMGEESREEEIQKEQYTDEYEEPEPEWFNVGKYRLRIW